MRSELSMLKGSATVFLTISTCLCMALSSVAQNQERFTARLSPVPIDANQRSSVIGKGAANAVLVGTKLTITGTFDGLAGPATVARLHLGPATGVRGTAFHDLTVSKAVSGTFSGSFDLTPEQVESLKKNKIYIQIHSEKAPDGNLWGWLLR
jgi:CHRD domain